MWLRTSASRSLKQVSVQSPAEREDFLGEVYWDHIAQERRIFALGVRQVKNILHFSASESDPEVFYQVLCDISQNYKTSWVKFSGHIPPVPCWPSCWQKQETWSSNQSDWLGWYLPSNPIPVPKLKKNESTLCYLSNVYIKCWIWNINRSFWRSNWSAQR